MRTFLLKIALFGVLLFGIDRLAGCALSYLSRHAKGGYVAHYHYLTEKTCEDMLIFGSSRAIHHYNPQIIEDSLHITCFNCGQEGSGIIQNYGFWVLIKEHYHPKYIVYDVMDGYDLFVGEDNHKYLGWLKESYDRNRISQIFYSVDKTERFKMLSYLYRYNSKFHQILGDYIYPVYKVKEKGFIPLDGNIDEMRINRDFNINEEFVFDTLKIQYINKLVNEMGDTKLVFIVSPSWYGASLEHYKPIDDICKKNNILFFNYVNDGRFLHKNEFFKDGNHLNSSGADKFTKILTNDLKNKYEYERN